MNNRDKYDKGFEKANPSSVPSLSPVSDVNLLSRREFNEFKDIIMETCAINLSSQKRLMLSVRISKRVRALKKSSFAAYLSYLNSEEGRERELHHLIDVVTTNKTDFFREAHHFEYLVSQLSGISFECGERGEPVRIWSAGCSTGEEPYTLAFVLADFFHDRLDRFSILATDVSTDVLKKAVRGIYSDDAVDPVPKRYRKKYLMRGQGEWKGHWRVAPEIRRAVQFGHLNFNDSDFAIPNMMDVIFCRNVMIYFTEETKRSIVNKLSRYLLPGGLFFIGHSETLHHISKSHELVSHTVYRKRSEQEQ